MSSTDHLTEPAADNSPFKDFFSTPDDIFSRLILETLNAQWSLVGDHPFFDTKQFPWIENLEASWRIIRSELETLLSRRDNLPNLQDISKDYEVLTQDNLWKTYILYEYGYRIEKSCQLCPETIRLIEQVPGMKTALFSIMGPRKHVPAHRGLYKGLLRYHLGLIVPEPNSACRIRVADEVRSWGEGKSLIFDDSFQHEVWNDSNEHRIVLILDVIRPLPFPVSLLNELAVERISSWPLVQGIKEKYESWENRHLEHT